MIRRLYVHNFRCLENFELPLSGRRSVLLLGRNGAGKSTVGLALELLQSIGRGVSRVGDLVKLRDLTNGRADSPMRFEIEVDLDGTTFAYSVAFEFPARFRELRVLDEKLQVDGRSIFTRKFAEVHIARGNSPTEVTFSIDWHLVALPIIQDQSSQDPLYTFKTWLKNLLILRPVPSLFHGITDVDAVESALLDPRGIGLGRWFTDMIAASPETYSHVSGYLSQVMPDFVRITNDIISKSTRSLVFQFARGEQIAPQLELDQLSDGEKCFVLYSLVIAANAAGRPIFCFWDEPDNFLAPDEVGHSIMGLRRAFRDVGQLVVTSHNPEAIRRFSEEDSFLFSRKSHSEPTTYQSIERMRQGGEYSGSFVDALLRGDVGFGAGS